MTLNTRATTDPTPQRRSDAAPRIAQSFLVVRVDVAPFLCSPMMHQRMVIESMKCV